MVFESFCEDDLVNEARVARPLILIERRGKRRVEAEILVTRGELFEEVRVE